MRREIPGIGSSWPLRRVGRTGDIQELGRLHALAADQYLIEPSDSALASGFASAGMCEGLPYFLQDQRPAGFLGRAVPLRYPELNLPQRVQDWSDEHYLRYLTRRGSDTVSDIILGNAAFDDYLSGKRLVVAVPVNERETRYPQLANQVMEGGLPGSSAHGEHPKFATLLQDTAGPRQVLVKFSPANTNAVGQRWSDLLIAEHHAHETLREAGIPAATSRIFLFAERAWLEVDRFDRNGLDGRIGVTSLFAIDVSRYGQIDNWIAAGSRLHRDACIDAQTFEWVKLASTFGGLIANTDRHFGNLAFYDEYIGRFTLAPIYDMLPMLFAPEHDQVRVRAFDAPIPTADTLSVWASARVLAEKYWRALAADMRISKDFRKISSECLATVEALPRTGAYAHQEPR